MIRYLLYSSALIALAGCQGYHPKPLDSSAHMAEWSARTVDADHLALYANRLGRVPPSERALVDGLALRDAELVALMFNPEVRAARAHAAAALASAQQAGAWDDPTISFDVLRVTESIPDPWVIGGMVGFTVPLSGRLSVEKDLAGAEYALELARVLRVEWETVAHLRRLWVQWSAARMESEQVRSLVSRIAEIVAIVDRLESSGTINRLEGRLFRMEHASRLGALLMLDARADELELELRSHLGLVPEAAITFVPQVALEVQSIGGDAFALVEQRSPRLAVQRTAYQVAEHALHAEVRKQYPDLQIGPAYEWDEGQSKIGLGGGLPLPLLNGNRRGIAVAEAQREAARIEYEAAHERLLSELRRAERHHQAASAARISIEQTLLPLTEQQLADERRLAELGELDVLLTLESVVRSYETRIQLVNARLIEAQAAIRLAELAGPEASTRATETLP